MDWTEKHRPRRLADVVGNGPSLAKLKAWAQAWQDGVPEKRAIILAGPPGTGKTSTALALAADMGWSVIELNASDGRNADVIKRVATAGALNATLSAVGEFSARKLIVLDEADNLYERLGDESGGAGSELSDRGGKVQIIETVRRTRQPIILIVNDLYALQKGSGSPLRTLAETLKFTRVNVRSIPPALHKIAAAEGIEVDRAVLETLAARAAGDLRAAVRDLQAIAMGRPKVTSADVARLGARDSTTSLFDLVRYVLKGRPLAEVRSATFDADATPEELVLWIDENLPKEYKDPADLARGYDALSRADIYLGHTRRTQNYALWSYASVMATLGVMTARQNDYRGYTPIGFPQWLSMMSRTRGSRAVQQRLALALGAAHHVSARKARTELLVPFTTLFRSDEEFRLTQSRTLDLSEDEIALLLDDPQEARRIRGALDKEVAHEGPARADADETPDVDDLDADEPPGSDAPGEDQEGAGEAPKRPTPGRGQSRLF